MSEKSQMRERILAAAQAALIEHNGQIEMADVARRADASVGLAYHYFGNKAGLISAVVKDFFDRYQQAMWAAAEQLEGENYRWQDRERARLGAAINFLFGDPAAKMMVANFSGSPEVLASSEPRRRESIEWAIKNIRMGIEQGDIDDHVNPNVVGPAVVGAVRVAMADALLSENPPSQDELYRELWRFIEDGVNGGKPRGLASERSAE